MAQTARETLISGSHRCLETQGNPEDFLEVRVAFPAARVVPAVRVDFLAGRAGPADPAFPVVREVIPVVHKNRLCISADPTINKILFYSRQPN